MPHAKTRPADPAGTPRVLVISRDSKLRERLYDTLSTHGYLVSTAASLQNGLEILQQGESCHAILLDGALHPGAPAPFVERIRYIDEKLPVILLERADRGAAHHASTLPHIQGCLPIDVDAPELLAAIARWLPPRRAATPINYPGTILIVDDEPELLKNLEAFLRCRGCTVAIAASGEEALAQAARCRPSLILLDIKMPGLDGLVTLKKLKALSPEVPVIMVTAVEDEPLVEQAAALGAYEYLVKPYNLGVLEGLLSHLKKRAERPLKQANA